MKISGTCLAVVGFLFLLSGSVYSQDLRRVEELGNEFQKQMPYSTEKPGSGETPGQAQPGDYVAPSEREQGEPAAQPRSGDYPVCYNPYTRAYEPCYPQDSEYWRTRYNSPDFRIWWEQGRSCPSGYYFRPGRGCYRY